MVKSKVAEDAGIRQIACADHVDADFFITCDDNLIKRAQRAGNIKVKVLSILVTVQPTAENAASAP